MILALIGFGLLLTLIVVWLLVRPLRRAPAVARETLEARAQLLQVRDRLLAQLNELDVEAGDRNIDATVLADERLRLEAELARVLKQLDAEVEPADPTAAAGTRAGWIPAAAALGVVLSAVATGLYVAQHHTTLARLDDPAASAQSVPPMVLEMVTRLEQRLQQQPKDPEGWARLGRAYQVLGQWDASRQAYARAYGLAPNDPEILSAYAGTLMAENPSDPSPEAVKLFKRLHELDPNYPGALWVLGLVAYNERQFRQATTYWERLLKQLPPDTEIEPQIRRAIEAARAEIGAKK